MKRWVPNWQRAKRLHWKPAQLLSWLGIAEPPVDVHAIARALHVNLFEVVEPGWSGAVQSSRDGNAVIWVDRSEMRTRQRFTIAHELGHLLLHPTGRMFRDNSYSGNTRETQANRFAADLLMPRWMLEQDLSDYVFTDRLLAQRYDVSLEAMRVRIKQIGAAAGG